MESTHVCHSFRPFAYKSSRVLILGSMPGPMALRKQEYYGFTGNHFWTIVPAILGERKPDRYDKKLALLKKHGIALWDVLESCTRPGAADSAIRNAVPNPIPQFLEKFPNILAVFINGQLAYKIFMSHYEGKVQHPVFCLPSSSPANAMISISEKTKKWGVILRYLRQDSPSNSPRIK